MKVLLINKYLYPKGGDAVSTLETGKLLYSRDNEVVLWGMDSPENLDLPYKKYFVSYIDYNKPLGIFKKLKVSMKILYSLEAKRKISELLKNWMPDIVHLNNFAHQISPSILDVFKKYRIPTVMTMRDYKMVCPAYSMLLNGKPCEKCKNGKYYYCFKNKCNKNCRAKSFISMLEMYLHHKVLKIYESIDYFIAPSKFLMNKVKEMGFNKRVVYLPNFVDLDVYKPDYNSSEDSIVYFGRLSEEKGLETLIDAVKNLNTNLKIIGSGPYKDRLNNKVIIEKIKNVFFLGYKKGEELRKIVGESLIVVVPSECYENCPRSILESFALGKPVIGSRIGGIPELVIDGETGYTFKAGDSKDLGGKIEYMLSNTDEVKKLERHYRKLIDIYNNVIKNNR